MARQSRHRRKVLVDVNNHDRWIVSYADFITLLFAFFVVMYSVSSVNQGKYRSLTESLGTAFSNKTGSQKTENKPVSAPALTEPLVIPQTISKDILAVAFEFMAFNQRKTAAIVEKAEQTKPAVTILNGQPIAPALVEPPFKASQLTPDILAVPFESVELDKQMTADVENIPELGEHKKTPDPAQIEPSAIIDSSNLFDMLTVPFESIWFDKQTDAELEETRELSAELLKERRQLNQVSDQLETALAPFIADDLVSVKRNDYWIELEMNSELLFLSGEAALSAKAPPALKKIAEVVNTLPNAINVEGHTDNIPIGTLIFPSNWELSSARATSVVQELIKAGTDPTRLSAVGYGEFHPIGDNSTEEGRFKNRRVTLVLMSQAFSRYGANDEERAKLLNLAPTPNVESQKP
jgi:chemotaxis protein MotB